MKALEQIVFKVHTLVREMKGMPQGFSVEDLAARLEEIRQLVEAADLKPDEPLFTIRGQDEAAIVAIDDYCFQAQIAGASMEFRQGVQERLKEFVTWQKMNHGLVKVPD